MKVAIIGNQARAMSNFWTVLITQLRERGHEVVCCLPERGPDDDPAWEAALEGLGARLVFYPLDRKGLNPLADARTLWALRRIFREERLDAMFAFTIKPVIYGALAAFLAGRPAKRNRHVMITGLGYMFEGGTPVKRLLIQVARGLYKLAFSRVHTVFFQNEDDRMLFEKLSIIIRKTRVRMCKGTGVDLERFALAPHKETAPHFLFVGRLLEAKGLRELAQAARLVKARHPEARFSLLGPREQGLGAISPEELASWEAEGIFAYLGETRDVRPFVADAGVVVLPSWREGTPCSLMEAMSMGRAVVAADAPGSREVVRDGVNGFLVPARAPEALAAALERFITDPALAPRMGREGRAMAEKELDATLVARGIIRDMGL